MSKTLVFVTISRSYGFYFIQWEKDATKHSTMMVTTHHNKLFDKVSIVMKMCGMVGKYKFNSLGQSIPSNTLQFQVNFSVESSHSSRKLPCIWSYLHYVCTHISQFVQPRASSDTCYSLLNGKFIPLFFFYQPIYQIFHSPPNNICLMDFLLFF